MRDMCQRCGSDLGSTSTEDHGLVTMSAGGFNRRWRLCDGCAKLVVDAARVAVSEVGVDPPGLHNYGKRE